MTYSAVMYSQRSHHYWDENTREVVTETTKGSFYGQAFNPSISASFNPQIFGMYSFKNTDARMQAIRHVMKPSVSFNYIPSLPGLSSDMYENVQIDTTGTRFRDYSIYEGNIYGTPSLSKKSGIVGFGLVNIIEGKMLAKNDTTGKARKIKIIDNFGINTSYNVFADSIKWSPVTMAIRTTLFNNFNLSANSSFSMYALDEKGRVYNAFLFSKSHQLLRLTNFTTSLDFSLSELLAGDKKKNKSTTSANSGADMFSQGMRIPGGCHLIRVENKTRQQCREMNMVTSSSMYPGQ
ncbi:MAG: hypothetical protein IPJ37_04640 [Bacteroidales bacterium]|nr:hypothetical protein [Bacteroidales bacterium]